MDIFGIGNDIIAISRIAASIERFGTAFLNRIFTKQEQAYCQKDVKHFAGRFAAKEAVVKALGTGITSDVRWHDIEIINDSRGKPIATLSQHLKEKYHIDKIFISISHCKEYATATAMITQSKME